MKLNNIKRLSLFFYVLFLLASCSSVEQPPKKTYLMRNYLAGKHLYKLNCENCHQKDGKGQGRLYPPLAQADYFLQDPNRAICIIKNGQEGKIIVNQQDYEITMLGFQELSTRDLADLMTYIGNAWGNNLGDVSPKEVEQALQNCE